MEPQEFSELLQQNGVPVMDNQTVADSIAAGGIQSVHMMGAPSNLIGALSSQLPKPYIVAQTPDNQILPDALNTYKIDLPRP